jgi:hypothetical protein
LAERDWLILGRDFSHESERKQARSQSEKTTSTLAENVLPPVALTGEEEDGTLIFDTTFVAIYDYALAGTG